MILLVGGSGFLGDHILCQLRAGNHDVRVLTMGGGDWQSNALSKMRHLEAEVYLGNLLDRQIVAAALAGCNVLINAAGGLLPKYGTSYREAHLTAVQILVEEAQKAGIQRFIQVSCLAANEHSSCEYYRLKWLADQLVQNSSFYWTIFRPSFLFAEQCTLVNLLKPWLKTPLIVPVFGSGLNKVQPVYVDDVATAITASIYRKECAGQIYELAGVQIYTLFELMKLICDQAQVKKPIVPMPLSAASKLMQHAKNLFPAWQINADFFQLLTADSYLKTATGQLPFQFKNPSLDHYLPCLLANS